MILCIVTVKPQRVKGKKRGRRGENRKKEKQGGESRFLTQVFD